MEDDCGHTITIGPAGPEHHEIPDDGAGHVPAVDCGCQPALDAADGGHVVYVHVDQEHDPDDDD